MRKKLGSVCCWWLLACGGTPPAAPPEVPVAASSGVTTAGTHKLAPLAKVFTKPTALMPRAVTSFGAAATSTHLYSLGGYFGVAHQYSREGQSAAFERMNLATGVWETLPSAGEVQSATLTEFNGKLYRIGGMRIDNAAGQPVQLASLDSVAVFDPALGRWQPLPSLPNGRSSHEAVRIGSQLYVVGGWKLAGDNSSGTWDDAMFVADLSQPTLQWRSLNIPFRLRALGVTAVGEQIVTVGGITASHASQDVHLYDTKTNTWSRGPDYPEQGFGVRAMTLGNRVLASGKSGTIYALNTEQSRWDEVASLSFPRVFHQFVATSETSGLALGGIPGMSEVDRIRHVETISLGQALDPITSFEIAAAGAAKNRQGLFLKEGQLYAFGGNNSLGQHDFAKENFVAEAHRLDLGSLQWKPVTPFPAQRQSMQTIETAAGIGYAIGGFGLVGDKQTTHTEVYLFDFGKETWTRTAQGLVQSRTQFGVAEHAERLWIFGGLDFDSSRQGADQFVHLLPVLTLDTKQPDSGFVVAGFDIPRPRRAFSGALLGDRYYMVGGMAAGFASVDECDVYDFKTRSWLGMKSPSRTRIGAEMVALGGKLYLAAGRSKGESGKLEENRSVEVYDPASDTWSPWLEALPMADTHQLRMLPFGERLLVYSAQRTDAKVQLLLLDPAQTR